jgi:hypothetical protein
MALNINGGSNGVNSMGSSVALISGGGFNLTDIGLRIGQHVAITVAGQVVNAIVITGNTVNGTNGAYIVFSIMASDLSKFTTMEGTVGGHTMRFSYMGTERSSYDAFMTGIKPETIYNNQTYYYYEYYLI